MKENKLSDFLSKKWWAGLTVLVMIFIFVFEQHCNNSSTQGNLNINSVVKDISSNKEEKDSRITSNNLTAEEIRARIKGYPYLENEIRSTYIGIDIKWDVAFLSISKIDDNIYRVFTEIEGDGIYRRGSLIFFDINIEKYSIFKIAKKFQRFWIVGKIKEINGYEFIIDIEKIYEK